MGCQSFLAMVCLGSLAVVHGDQQWLVREDTCGNTVDLLDMEVVTLTYQGDPVSNCSYTFLNYEYKSTCMHISKFEYMECQFKVHYPGQEHGCGDVHFGQEYCSLQNLVPVMFDGYASQANIVVRVYSRNGHENKFTYLSMLKSLAVLVMVMGLMLCVVTVSICHCLHQRITKGYQLGPHLTPGYQQAPSTENEYQLVMTSEGNLSDEEDQKPLLHEDSDPPPPYPGQ